MDIERFNKNGLQDGYRVLKCLKERDERVNREKGGKIMPDEDDVQPIKQEEEMQGDCCGTPAEREAQDIADMTEPEEDDE